ncbi:MAG TPA: prolyl oligopeptidase family serine peptidase [Asanoa sp.]
MPELAAQASPVSYADPAAPPFLLLHGRDDRLVPRNQSERLSDLRGRAGSPVEFDVYDGADHNVARRAGGRAPNARPDLRLSVALHASSGAGWPTAG